PRTLDTLLTGPVCHANPHPVPHLPGIAVDPGNHVRQGRPLSELPVGLPVSACPAPRAGGPPPPPGTTSASARSQRRGRRLRLGPRSYLGGSGPGRLRPPAAPHDRL